MIKWILGVITLFSQLNVEAQISDFKNADFKNADNIAYNYKGNDLSNLPELTYNLTHNLTTDVEKFRAIYTWVCTNIKADHDSYLKNSTKRIKYQNDSLKLNKWNETFSNQVFKKLLKEKETVCTGYAYLVKKIANLANLKCEIINGFGRNESSLTSEYKLPNHSWNAVQLNNKWYLCDATWSSGAYNLDSYRFEFKYSDGYFLADPELFAKDHFPIDEIWLLKDEKTLFSDFLENPIIYDNAYNFGIIPIAPSKMHIEVERNRDTSFIIKDLKGNDIKAIFLQINYGSSVEYIKPKIEFLKNDETQITYSFTKLGTFDVHINLGSNPICSYVVKVKKRM